jgi:hypothetical protein
LVLVYAHRLTIDPGFVSKNALRIWLDGVHGLESDMGLRRPTAWRCLILEKDGKNLDAFERLVSRVSQFQKDIRSNVNELKGKRLGRSSTHHPYFLLQTTLEL